MSADADQAAGGLVVRDGRVALVHRPKYDDWSLPKGHLDPGETALEAALREVEEEAGLRCRPVQELEPVRYVTRKGRPKVVSYWLMEAREPIGAFLANDEVDELRWAEPSEALALLSYEGDRGLVAQLTADLFAR